MLRQALFSKQFENNSVEMLMDQITINIPEGFEATDIRFILKKAKIKVDARRRPPPPLEPEYKCCNHSSCPYNDLN